MQEKDFDGRIIACPQCGEEIRIVFSSARCAACGWMAADSDLEEIMEE